MKIKELLVENNVKPKKPSKKGDCFQAAGRNMIDMKIPELVLVHAGVTGQGPIEGVRHAHAWNEIGDFVIDNSNKRNIMMRKELYYQIGNIDPNNTNEYKKYNREDALKFMVKTKHWGPWELSNELAESNELDEKWSAKYKRSINCANPKGFSQRAHCQGRKKNNEEIEVKDVHKLANKKGVEWDMDPDFMAKTKELTGKEHLDDLDQNDLKKIIDWLKSITEGDLIPLPKGTVKVDVSDVYDWYKLGMHISNLKGLGRHDFGKGPPQTVMAFGSEPMEHKYLKYLAKLGLRTHDVDENFEGKKPLHEEQRFDFDKHRDSILRFVQNALDGKPNNRQYNPFYELIVGGGQVGAATKLGIDPKIAAAWKQYFQSKPFIGGAGEPWSQVNIGDQYAKTTGDDRTLNFYVTVAKDRDNILRFFKTYHSLASYLQPISQQYQTPIKFKTHSLLDSFIGHNDSFKVYYYDPKLKNEVVTAVKKWLSDNSINTSARSHEHGVDVKSGGGSFGQLLSNYIYDEFTKLINTYGNKFTPEQYFNWLKTNLHILIGQVKAKENTDVEENFADGKKPGRKGLAKRMGVPTKASASKLRKIAKSSTGEKQRMAHWLANMKSGKKK